jgi:5-formyltetrahydrofolate cyclo-ligase
MTKNDLRERLRERRNHFAEAEGASASQLLNELVIHAGIIPLDAVIAGYYPTKGEVDAQPAIHHYLAQGHRCCLPFTCFGTRILQFREFLPSSVLSPDAQQILAPLTGAEIIPSVVLIPMVGFDQKGYRLGQGGGHYDSTLDYLRNNNHLLAIGLAFDCQEVEALPLEIHDQPMDYIITPTRILSF